MSTALPVHPGFIPIGSSEETAMLQRADHHDCVTVAPCPSIPDKDDHPVPGYILPGGQTEE